jgi:hypothetical protein
LRISTEPGKIKKRPSLLKGVSILWSISNYNFPATAC